MANVMKRHGVDIRNMNRQRHWHSAQTLDRWRVARNKRNKVAKLSRRRNRS